MWQQSAEIGTKNEVRFGEVLAMPFLCNLCQLDADGLVVLDERGVPAKRVWDTIHAWVDEHYEAILDLSPPWRASHQAAEQCRFVVGFVERFTSPASLRSAELRYESLLSLVQRTVSVQKEALMALVALLVWSRGQTTPRVPSP